MSINKINYFLGFDDFWFRIIGIPLIGALVPPVFFQTPFDNSPNYWISAFISFIYTLIYWQVCRKVFIIANKKYPAIEQLKKRLIFIIIVCGTVIFLFCPIIHIILKPLVGLDEYIKLGLKQPTLFQVYAANVTIHLAIASIYESIRNLNLYELTLLEKEQIEKAQIASQLEGLKSQVNPHFLFNSLNTLVSIIPEDSERSIRFVRLLSKIYRYFLDTTSEKVVSLEKEMDFVKAYTTLLKERFGDNINIMIGDYESYKDCRIIPFALQLLIENCIKHNIISTEKHLTIQIIFEKDQLLVKNNFQPKHQVQESTGVGLQNIEKRYALLSSKKVSIVSNENDFYVILPLL